MKRLTTMEIFNKDFKNSFRGYDIKEVNEFLDLIIKSYEDVLQENEHFKKRLQQLTRKQNENDHPVYLLSQYDKAIQEILVRLDRLEKSMGKLSSTY
jgi:DivIVA domain-containing protein